MIVPVGIALGSNLGDRDAELEAGLSFLRSLSVQGRLLESARLETAPVDCPPGSAPFLNAVTELQLDASAIPPHELLRRLQAFEKSRGRPAERAVNAPRPLDLDILYYGSQVVNEPDLIIPHPRAAQRRFVLEPLAQIRPELVLPGQTRTVRELL
jgi:2-amino-4-hydroxy-6-hydroxymethyldihydropteridine diphosphokinase